MSHAFQVIFGGDLSLSGIFYNKVSAKQEIFSGEISALLKSTDFLVANLEGPITAKSLNAHAVVDLRQPLNCIEYFKQYGNPVLNLANNHSLDCGIAGLQDTFKHIESAGARYFGAAESPERASGIEYLTIGAIRIALIAIAFCDLHTAETTTPTIFSASDIGRLKKQIQKASSTSDWVIVNVHGGEEYTRFPSPSKRKFLRRLAAIKGVDIVIAHHAHVFQGIEKFKDSVIFHSLGNFIFNIERHNSFPATQQSALVKFTFTKKKYKYELIPIEIDLSKGLIQAADLAFLKEIKQRSDFSGYYRQWLHEAHHVLFTKSNHQSQQNDSGLKGQSFFQLISKADFYKRSLKILADSEKRSIYFGALFYRLLKKTGFKI